MTRETAIILQAIFDSKGNVTTVGKYATGLLIVGRRKENRKTIMPKTSFVGAHYVEKFKKIITKNISKNG